MKYQTKNFENLIGTPGLSETLLKNHFLLYEGYVANTNKLIEGLDKLIKESKGNAPEYAELKRRFGWEWNGMRLHEFYFGNISKETAEMEKNSEIYKKIVSEFGSFENWENDFKNTAAMRGIGWAILYHDQESKKLFNAWINEHDKGNFSGADPILVIDVFEHAYMLDYGIKKADYIETALKIINWKVLEKRLEKH